MVKYRFIGNRPFEKDDNIFFTGRESIISEIENSVINNKLTILQGKKRAGKTSVIKAGFWPKIDLLVHKKIIYIDFKNKDIDYLNQIKIGFEKFFPLSSYLDKLDCNEDSLWFLIKKVQGENPVFKDIILVFDHIEEIFDNASIYNNFIDQLKILLIGDIPDYLNESIQQKLSENPQLITKQGYNLLFTPIKVSVILVTNDYVAPKLCEEEYLQTIKIKKILINYFNTQESKEIIRNTFLIPSGNFKGGEPISITDNEDNFLYDFLNYKEEINPEILQTAGLCYEKTIMDLENSENDKNFLEEKIKEKIINHYNDCILKNESANKIISFLKTEPLLHENEFIYYQECFFNAKYNIQLSELKKLDTDNILQCKKIEKDNYFAITNHLFLKAFNENKSAKKVNKSINEKSFKNVIFYIFIILITGIISLFAGKEMKLAKKRAAEAKSNLLSVYAFEELKKNPTISLRLAQEALKIDTKNPSAYSALINSFYSTNIFYTITGHLDINAKYANLSDNQNYITIINEDKTNKIFEARIYDLNYRLISKINHNDVITSIKISNNSQYILSTSYDNTAKLWSLQGKLLHTFTFNEEFISTCCFSKKSDKIITAGYKSGCTIWNLKGEKITNFAGHDLGVYSIQYSPDDSKIITSGGDNLIKLWNSEGKLIKEIQIKDNNQLQNTIIVSASFSPDGKEILAACNDLTYKIHIAGIWDIDGNMKTIFRGHDDWINCAIYSNYGDYILTCSMDKTIKIWNREGKLLKNLVGHEANIWYAGFNSDTKSIYSFSADKTIRKWEFGKTQEPFQNVKNINYACFSPNGLTILTISDNKLILWNLLGEKIQEFNGHTNNITHAFFTDDNKNIISTGMDSSLIIWNLQGEKLQIIKQLKEPVTRSDKSVINNKLVIGGYSGSICILDEKLNCFVKTKIHSGKVNDLKFSKDGNFILTAGDDSTACLLNSKGQLITKFTGHLNSVTSASFSPDCKTIITTSNDATAKIWNMSGKNILTLNGYNNKVNSAEFSPDGKLIVTASDDLTARLFTLSGKEIMTFKHPGKVTSASFSQNGNYILTVYEDEKYNKTFKIWIVGADEILRYIDDLKIFGEVWKLNAQENKKFGIIENQ